MKCNRVDCFAYSPVQSNNCSILTSCKNCNFYKTMEQIGREEEALRSSGHPVYRPSVTRQDQRILKALLSGDGERTDYMDQTKQKHS